MPILFRWMIRLTGGLVLLVLAVVLGGYYLASRSLPEYDRLTEVEGLGGAVEIVRDNANVPHIEAGLDEDVYFGLGYVHAQDRLWQMTMLRRTAQGKLSEIFGPRTARIDELIRRFDLYGNAQRSVPAQDARTLAALEAYARGVNARIKQVNDEALGRGAPEFFIFSPEIAFWQPADSIAIGKLMALQMSGHISNEVLRARASLALTDARLNDLMPVAPGTGVAELPRYSALFPAAPTQLASAPAPRDPLSPLPPRGLGGASNAWAASSVRSAAGGTLLANDPHLGLTAPAIWYLAGLKLTTGAVIGGTIPGAPIVLVGRSEHLAWGLTTTYADDQDVLIEKLNPDNPEEYLTPEGYKPFETRRTILNIKGSAPQTITLRWTENGPVLPGSHYDLATITPPGHVASVAWTNLWENDTTATAAMRLMQAQSVDEALQAVELWRAPVQTLTLIDADHIAMQVVGALPSRSALHQTQGRIPAPGWLSENRWAGALPYADNPRFTDPEGGILGNTNNKIIDRAFPRHLTFDWGDSQRIQRWRNLMQNREVHTRESFIEAQLDTVSFTARALLPLIARDLWYTGEAAPRGTTEHRRQQALEMLANWNGEMNEHMPEPLIYAAWLRHLQDRLIRDDLGPLADEFTHVEPLFIERVYRDINGAATWCDIHQSTAKETCAEIARIALDEALLWINETYGGNLESLRWGDAHQARHDHPVLGDVPILRWFVNIRQSTSGGDFTLMRGVSAGTGSQPFANVHGAGYRGVYDFADPDSSVFVISTGQSGHPLSRHYDDLGELWRRGEYIPMSLDPQLARAANVGITTLVPKLDD
ncbi:penicillin acylase family protein [Actibacterium sp. XHP0104]|uniref:penicillin acylase family protein n=1 Tax=Actibacterium sp. XHP0104 TaxID=2984335 RepID=UPI0021E72A79|nr:penicillin acylase family protein [Actibacterium sp. XHP0104]MCV2881072.1 penicillin acylase family protein [Actibacterium sp. XHP0104]